MAKQISIREFKDRGFLQEVNRQFFHPLGMALVVEGDDVTGEWESKADHRCRTLGYAIQPLNLD